METKEDYTESITYMVEMLDNGITLTIPEQDFKQCEKFTDIGKDDDDAMIKFIGKNLWADIKQFADYKVTNDIKIELTISKNE